MANGIYKKILDIQKEVPTLQKNGVGPQTQGSYKFLSIDDILSAIKPLLDKHGVVVHANLLDYGYEFTKAGDKGDGRVPKAATVAWVKYEFKFVDTSDGSAISTVVLGEGADSSDKATRKATTSAWKIALIQTFSLITGEADPDAQDGANVPESATSNPKIDNARPQAKAAPAGGKDALDKARAELQATAAQLELNFEKVLSLGDEKFKVGRGVWTSDVDKINTLVQKVLENKDDLQDGLK